MIDQVLSLLTSGSPMVAFAVYLIWSNSRSEKRLDELNSQFMGRVDTMVSENKAEIEALRIRYEEREDAQRDRWQTVVTQLQQDRESMERDILRNAQTTREAVEKLSLAVEAFNQQITAISGVLTLVTDKLQQIDQKTDRMLDRGRS
jgi:hypothetical protein